MMIPVNERETTKMLSPIQVARIARALWARLGETAVAAAMLKAQMAGMRGDLIRQGNWRQIAQALSGRMDVQAA